MKALFQIYDPWHVWFYERWLKGEGPWLGGYEIQRFVLFAEYDGFGGEF